MDHPSTVRYVRNVDLLATLLDDVEATLHNCAAEDALVRMGKLIEAVEKTLLELRKVEKAQAIDQWPKTLGILDPEFATVAVILMSIYGLRNKAAHDADVRAFVRLSNVRTDLIPRLRTSIERIVRVLGEDGENFVFSLWRRQNLSWRARRARSLAEAIRTVDLWEANLFPVVRELAMPAIATLPPEFYVKTYDKQLDTMCGAVLKQKAPDGSCGLIALAKALQERCPNIAVRNWVDADLRSTDEEDGSKPRLLVLEFRIDTHEGGASWHLSGPKLTCPALANPPANLRTEECSSEREIVRTIFDRARGMIQTVSSCYGFAQGMNAYVLLLRLEPRAFGVAWEEGQPLGPKGPTLSSVFLCVAREPMDPEYGDLLHYVSVPRVVLEEQCGVVNKAPLDTAVAWLSDNETIISVDTSVWDDSIYLHMMSRAAMIVADTPDTATALNRLGIQRAGQWVDMLKEINRRRNTQKESTQVYWLAHVPRTRQGTIS